jgi:2'-5' RNA ligase
MKLTTTLTIIAPHEVQAIAVPTMQRYCFDSLLRMAAHLTVLFPFVPFERLDNASDILRELCANVEAFDVTMNGYGAFPQVAFMKPDNPQPIQVLFRKVFAAFPECPPYEGEFGDNITPHMTVGEFASEEEQARAILPDYEPITFRVSRLHLMYGIHQRTLPWITHTVIPLKKAKNRE